jgi:hypothetical protein
VELADLADLAEHLVAELEAVLDLRRRAHVDQRAQHGLVLVAQVGAADEVGRVLAVGHPARSAARRAVLAEREHRRAARVRAHERVGVDRDEEVGLDAARLLDALVQRHEEVRIARHHRAHVRLRVEAVAQHERDREDDVLLARAARPDRARVLAAVPGIDRDDDEAIDLALRRLRRQRLRAGLRRRDGRRARDLRCGRVRRRRCGERRRQPGRTGGRGRRRRRRGVGRVHPADELAERVLHRLRRLLLGLLLVADQLEQRVALAHRTEVEDEPVLVRGDRREREQLGRDRLLEVDDEADDARLVLADANAGDVRIVGPHLADDLAQLRAELEAVDVDHEAIGPVREEVAGAERRIGLDRHPRVVVRRPDAHRDDRRAPGDLARAEQQHERADARERAAARRQAGVSALTAAAPGRFRSTPRSAPSAHRRGRSA